MAVSEFAVGARVSRMESLAQFHGTVVAVFRRLDGTQRYVVEAPGGLLAIFRPGDLGLYAGPEGETEIERLQRESKDLRTAIMAAATALLLAAAGRSVKSVLGDEEEVEEAKA